MNGGSISHSSAKQSITTLSSMESEYIGGTNAAQEVVFLRKLYTSILPENKSILLLLQLVSKLCTVGAFSDQKSS